MKRLILLLLLVSVWSSPSFAVRKVINCFHSATGKYDPKNVDQAKQAQDVAEVACEKAFDICRQQCNDMGGEIDERLGCYRDVPSGGIAPATYLSTPIFLPKDKRDKMFVNANLRHYCSVPEGDTTSQTGASGSGFEGMDNYITVNPIETPVPTETPEPVF